MHLFNLLLIVQLPYLILLLHFVDLNMAEVEEIVTKTDLPEIKMFGRWSTDDVQVSDISLTVSECRSRNTDIIKLEKFTIIAKCVFQQLV